MFSHPLRLCCWAVLALGCGVLAKGSAQSREGNLQQAEQDYNQGHYRDAERLLAGLVAQQPTDFSANELLGLVLSAEGQEVRATAPLEQAARSDPHSIPARENLAANYARRGMKGLAEKQFIQLARLDPNNFAVMHNLGEFYIQEGKIAAAVPWLRKAQEIDPTNYSNGYDLSLGFIETGQLPAAEAQLNALVRVRDTAELHSLLAEAYEKDGKVLLAGSEYQDAARMDPKEDTVFDWGAELLRHRDLPQAKQIFARGSSMFPHSTRMLIGLGLAEHLAGNDDPAIRNFLQAIDLDPANRSSYYFLSIMEHVPVDLRGPVTARFKRYAERFPGRGDAQYYYAANLWSNNEMSNGSGNDKAIEQRLERALRLDPGLYEAHDLLGTILQDHGEYTRAVQQFEAAIRDQPSLQDAHYQLAHLLYRLGQKQKANAEMQQFRRLHSTDKDHRIESFLVSGQGTHQ